MYMNICIHSTIQKYLDMMTLEFLKTAVLGACAHVLWPKGLHIIWSKEKSCSRNGAFKETSRPCANLQWPIGPWTSAKWLHSRSTAAPPLLMSRVEAHLLPSLTIQRRASSQDCLPKTSSCGNWDSWTLVLSFIVSWSSKQVDLQAFMLIPSYRKKAF